MSPILDLRSSGLPKKAIAGWLLALLIVAALVIVWSVRDTTVLEPTRVVLQAGP